MNLPDESAVKHGSIAKSTGNFTLLARETGVDQPGADEVQRRLVAALKSRTPEKESEVE